MPRLFIRPVRRRRDDQCSTVFTSLLFVFVVVAASAHTASDKREDGEEKAIASTLK